MINYRYYKVKTGSPVMKTIKDTIQKLDVFKQAMRALETEFGAPVITLNQRYFEGIQFPGPAPSGWKKKSDYHVPDRRNADGRALLRRFAKLPKAPDSYWFSSTLGGQYLHFGNGHIHFSGFEKLGHTYVLCVPDVPDCPACPPGCDRLQLSQYWLLKSKDEAIREKEQERKAA